MIQKTEYEMIGAGLSRIVDKDNRLRVATDLSVEFSKRNPQFDRARFLQCAEVWPCEFCENLAENKSEFNKHFVDEHYNSTNRKQVR